MGKTEGYVYTGVGASEDEEAVMLDAVQRPLPLIVVGGYVPPSPGEVMHGFAIRHGLPEIRGHYGYDFGEHEFIRLPDAEQGPADEWPSRKLSDIVGRG